MCGTNPREAGQSRPTAVLQRAGISAGGGNGLVQVRGRAISKQSAREGQLPAIYILNGPNLNLLGVRDPSVYGRDTLADIEERCLARAASLDLQIEFRQTNHEGPLAAWIPET